MNRIWTIHLTTLIALVVWPATDPSFETMVRLRSFSDAAANVGWVRSIVLVLIATIAVTSLSALFISMFRRSRVTSRSRSLRQLLTIIAEIRDKEKQPRIETIEAAE